MKREDFDWIMEQCMEQPEWLDMDEDEREAWVSMMEDQYDPED